MDKAKINIIPVSSFFVGREEFCQTLIEATQRTNAVLLFGGRQAGKTTTLIRVRDILSESKANTGQLSAVDVAIYVDLNLLKYDASPKDFFKLLLKKAVSSCSKQISGAVFQEIERNTGSVVDDFICGLKDIKSQCGEVEPKFVFLLDESKRVLGDRFPRGFQDNLFSLLYGEESGSEYNIVMVFAGAQHLYAFSQDDTSPIGSRAASLYLTNLTVEAVRSLAIMVFPTLVGGVSQSLADNIYEVTGGHAGLTVRILESLYRTGATEVHLQWAQSIMMPAHRGLLENWSLSLSPEAKVFARQFAHRDSASISYIASVLSGNGLEPHLAHRVMEEIQYMGLGVYVPKEIYRRNNLFWSYYSELETSTPADVTSNQVWLLIESTELVLRELIRIKYEANLGEQYQDTMRKVLGAEVWGGLVNMVARSDKRYKYSESSERDIMSCMYFGHLKDLMISGQSWAYFKSMFRDKRELEDKVSAIIPVRNDNAHFTPTPSKELDRCRIACDDLLVIAERELSILN
ncbi:hypothetical protein ACS77_15435 [Pseudomonas syringae]|uniref:Uncharacterized protein n=1 Tax=Pseudomonas syringae TaxID=317 RepID=A0A0L1MDW5_PSESX|nr:hypothetical protein ACS77_15435 [Pseudomonas syringae]